ncbi:MAG: hypothetical protein GKS00_26240 [Alphaproteobacteria bacterium]|nr:hypothetical protein [Alphaproteobacteria bacterium]
MAVAALGIEFVDRIKNELSENRTHVEHAGDDPAALDIKQIFTFAHDMRGQGGSFGYPLISEIGGSLCHFIESRDHSFQADDITVLRAHLDAANAIISSAMSGEGDTVSRALIDSLDALVRKQLTGQF